MFDLIVKNADVVTSDGVKALDFAVKDGKVAALAQRGALTEAKKVLDLPGKLVFPGAIDTHAHLNDPGYNWRETFDCGTAAAAVGGYTTIIDMPLQNDPPTTNAERIAAKLKHVGPKAYTDYCFWGGLTDYNFGDLEGEDAAGVVAFKSFIGPVSPDYVSLSYGQVREALEIIARFGGVAGFHCEDFSLIKWGEERAKRKAAPGWQDFLDSRPLVAEYLATEAVILLSKETGCRVHICHVSHPSVAQLVRDAQNNGIPVTAETCSHYLTLTEDDVLEKGELFKCAPPLRSKEARDLLWNYVIDGTFSGIASDHSPCAPEEKDEKKHGVFGAWGGISGIQNCLQLCYNAGVVERGIDPSVLARVMSENAAKTFGIWGKKGAILPGFDADFVVLDPEAQWEITADSLLYVNKISAFVGMKGKGLPVQTYIRGQLVAENGHVRAEMKGKGQYVKKIRA
ncbi:MAG: allantoinase AllB [Pyramidobacter sp.]|jgi:allantoinase